MAVLRSLLLRHRTTILSLLRARSLSSSFTAAAAISSHSVSSPGKTLAFSHSPPWKGILVRRFGSSSPEEAAEIVSEGVSSDPPASAVEYRPGDPSIDELEGCDFNHWLIVVDFPKDPRPSPEEMIRFYEETCAKTLNLSLEEAKKKIYATSTSNYTGFHVQVTEPESEKFNGQPGVVFVLPDSYSDEEKKEYGGDKYINGVIIPRPRPTKRRYWDVQPKQRGPMPDQQVSSSNNTEIRIPNLQEQTTVPYSQESSSHQPNQLRISPPYTHQGLTQGPRTTNLAPPTYHPPQQSYYLSPGQGMATPPRTPYQQGSAGFVPYEGSYTHGWTWNYAPPPPPQGFFNGPQPQATAYYIQGVNYTGYHGHQEANWQRGNIQGQYYSSPVWYYQQQQVHGPPQQHNWQGHSYSGYPTPPPPNQGQGYATPGHYERQQPQEQQQQDNGNQGQGHHMGYWGGPNYYTTTKG